jgi:hypothetical protein
MFGDAKFRSHSRDRQTVQIFHGFPQVIEASFGGLYCLHQVITSFHILPDPSFTVALAFYTVQRNHCVVDPGLNGGVCILKNLLDSRAVE